LGAALVAGLALWWWGLRQAAGKRIWPALVPMLLSVATLLIVPVNSGTATHGAARILDAIDFDEAQLATLRAQHQPVFVFVTADWCLTCKVNELGAMSSAEVASAFKQQGVTVMEADWTHNDPAITRFLSTNGRAGVPLYLWYPSTGTAAQALPQVLTSASLVKLVGG
jgi:thiol:disulfide interchange protein